MVLLTFPDKITPRAAETTRRHRNIYAQHGLSLAPTALAPSNSSFVPLGRPADPSPIGNDHGPSTRAWQGSGVYSSPRYIGYQAVKMLLVLLSLWPAMHGRLVGLGFFFFFCRENLRNIYLSGGVQFSAHSPSVAFSVDEGPLDQHCRNFAMLHMKILLILLNCSLTHNFIAPELLDSRLHIS